MFKKIVFLILIIVLLLHSFSFMEESIKIKDLNLGESKNLKVSLENSLISFKPIKDGRYEFLIETKPLDTSESFIKRD
ncbi:MAG: hypothetical protein ACQEQE_10555, partial [Bacillota bacterium]